jgi:hypothetical protein
MTPDEIERTYREDLLEPFPYDDCRRLRVLTGHSSKRLLEGLTADLDFYFSYIAGFASSASRLRQRSPEQLIKAIPFLERGFFEHFPRYESLSRLICPEETPVLHRQLVRSDLLRVELAAIMRSLVDA